MIIVIAVATPLRVAKRAGIDADYRHRHVIRVRLCRYAATGRYATLPILMYHTPLGADVEEAAVAIRLRALAAFRQVRGFPFRLLLLITVGYVTPLMPPQRLLRCRRRRCRAQRPRRLSAISLMPPAALHGRC